MMGALIFFFLRAAADADRAEELAAQAREETNRMSEAPTAPSAPRGRE